ncbi:hypothetical protein GUJ93_ZPchr0012g20145 [Zizania palustris]|uniref:Uncharacterized protein n=1 Tax=Zizania palustris TaxID=103762 RepID=A0A8J5WPC9_ZIZPA|nr:hypothetical protein GUJ93_ZPchr0012g20145 [Zizania palustris]
MRTGGAPNGPSGRPARINSPCRPTELLLLNWPASRASTFTSKPKTSSLISPPLPVMMERGAPAAPVDPRFLQRQVVAAAAAAMAPGPSKTRDPRELRQTSVRFREQTLELGPTVCSAWSIELATRGRLGPSTEARKLGLESIPEPREVEVIFFEAFFDAGLGFPGSELLSGILDAFHLELPPAISEHCGSPLHL